MARRENGRRKLTTNEYWDSVYHSLHGARRAMVRPGLRYSVNELLRFIRPHLPTATPDHPVRLVEMGCGNSLWLPYFAEHWGYRVSGIDYSEAGCRMAEQNLEASGCSGTIHCIDFSEVDGPLSQRHDVVVSFGVVEHFADIRGIVGTFARALAPGGTMVTSIPNMSGGMGRMQRRLSTRAADLHVPLDRETLVEAHEANGLEVLAASYLCFLGLGMLNAEGTPWSSALRALQAGADLLHLQVRRLTRWRPQSASWSSFIAVVARRPDC